MIKPIGKNYYRRESSYGSDRLSPAEIPIPEYDIAEEAAEPEGDISEHELSNGELVAATAKFFARDGQLKALARVGGRPYEWRAQQAEMAKRVAEALRDNHNLCVEAPTGVGKSFAYLVPLLHYAKAQGKPAIVSTETINLQEQLFFKDIPVLQQLLPFDFAASLAKGRGNYLCLRRLQQASGEYATDYLPSSDLLPQVKRIVNWAEETEDGSLGSLDFTPEQQLWRAICSESWNCAGPKCAMFRRCFYWKARRQWEKSDIIIANHALFLTDLNMQQAEELNACLLPVYSAVVIDEAHTLEDNAADYLGLKLNSTGTKRTLQRLFNPETGRGLLLKSGMAALELRRLTAEVIEAAEDFFSYYLRYLNEHEATIRRVKHPNIAPDLITQPLRRLEKELRHYIAQLDDDDFQLELDAQLKRCQAITETADCFINMSCPEHVYWAEKEHNSVTLTAALLKVNALLDKMLFSRHFPVILTSATLTVNKNFDYYRRRTGYGHGTELMLNSPFDPRQGLLYLPNNYMPDPRDPDFNHALVDAIRNLITLTDGKALVLFTSYASLRYCAERLEAFCASHGIRLLAQGSGLSRHRLLDEFRSDTNSVLFGTDSFWTGVDVPGETLSNVIVTKFPFAVPLHPLIKARCEEIEASGGNAFMEYSLPEAILKFRQGIGRLIRSRDDRGIIAILDRRVVSQPYGRYFINSIPDYPQRRL